MTLSLGALHTLQNNGEHTMDANEIDAHARSEHKSARAEALIAAMKGRYGRALMCAGRADGFMGAVDFDRCLDVLVEVSEVIGDTATEAHMPAYMNANVNCERRIMQLRKTYAITPGNPAGLWGHA